MDITVVISWAFFCYTEKPCKLVPYNLTKSIKLIAITTIFATKLSFFFNLQREPSLSTAVEKSTFRMLGILEKLGWYSAHSEDWKHVVFHLLSND